MRRWFSSTRGMLLGILGLQLVLAAMMMGRDLAASLPHMKLPSAQPGLDAPVLPGDQTRRFRPRDTPLVQPRDGQPSQPFRNTGDMPRRLAFDVDGTVLRVVGTISPGDGVRFADSLAANENIERVHLNSPGGSVADALEIGRLIRETEIDTAMDEGDICLSACPYILAGGVARTVHSAAQVGVHQHSFGTNTVLPAFLAVEDIQRGQGRVMSYLDEMGINPLVMQHALITPPNEIYVLLPDQLLEYALVTDAAPQGTAD